MKNIITFLIVAISFQFAHAQEFIATNKYTVANRIDTKQEAYASVGFDIVATEDPSLKIASLNILDLDFFEDVTISLLKDPNLDNINEIIKVDINYSTCCNLAETHYFMVTYSNQSISLPAVENIYCENTESEIQYIFPVQALGKEAIILKTEVSFTETHTMKGLKILQRFAWNDNDFNHNESIAYTGIDNN
ncbi:hypothetical protein [Xanthomarina sp. F2636L]|uniref:hypothetical protein n=1 Tax=Xanthomarina sp. F2636L TaxID=2996018 RepID=UPI00225E3BD0|nr:hypothetical protein [Xanthomarina sp. F2636L]MCX7549632.1 hypothetical protein [Xanthomarina sp. F2636L]